MNHPVLEQIKQADQAIVTEDFDTLLDINFQSKNKSQTMER